MKTNEDLRKKARDLMRNCGIPFSTSRSVDWFNGKVVSAGPRRKVDYILHDAAHWILADDHRRSIVNFGLGDDPESTTPGSVESPELSNDPVGEEIMASGLGAMLVAWIGGDYSAVLKNQSWDTSDQGIRDLRKAAQMAVHRAVEVPDEVVAQVEAAYCVLRGPES